MTWIVLLITGAIFVAFWNCSRWNRDRGSCLKYELIWWRKGLHKYRRDLMESITEVVLLKSEELTLVGRIPSGKMISSGEENNLRNVSDTTLAWRFSLRVSPENIDGEGHVSWSWHGSDFDYYNNVQSQGWELTQQKPKKSKIRLR